MEPDKYQQAWQAHSAQTRVTIDADVLLKEVQYSQQNFRATILWRDFHEAGISLLMIPLWFFLGIMTSSPWTWYLTVPALVWVAGFIIVDRMRHKQKPSEPDDSLLTSVKESLAQVEHQIWLLRNIVWWYLLPFTISILAFFAHISWLSAIESNDWLAALGFATILFGFILGVYSFVYYMNQRAVDSQLEPRRQELLTLLASLRDETTSEVSGEYPILMSRERFHCSPRRMFVASLCFVAILFIGVPGILFIAYRIDQGYPTNSRYDRPPRSSGPGGDSLASLITDLRKEKKLVGLAAMVMVDGQVEAAAADGERKIASGVPLEIGDRWHLGGITKSITATMIARLIESDQMQWKDTVGEIFPEASVHEDWKPVTLRQLLTDTAGAPRNFPEEVLRQRPALGPECTQARREAVLNVIADKPAFAPGKMYAYSNVGYTIAGAMAEKVTGATWEDLMKREVFEPLELSEAGFGPPKSADETLQQPRGHRVVLGRKKVSVDDTADNTPIMGPAGTVHMTLQNLCTFAREHLLGQLGTGKLLADETYKTLHLPELDAYACGWLRKEPSAEIPYTAYWHNGSNAMWYALVVFIPERNMVVAVTSNDGDSDQAEAAAWEIVEASAEYPKVSPFAGVRWQESQPEIKVGDEWLKLVALDELPAAEIVAFSRWTYGDKWQKRFEEDLVELLTRMGHPPQDTVTLVVQSLTSSEIRILEDVPMTRGNRRAIRDAAQDLEGSE